MMRIITGTARGCRLDTLEGEATRPTTERVKEAVFSMIQFDLEGRRVLDLFAGSGQLGLEALSRGADKATFIDVSREAADIVIANAKKTRLFDRCRISVSDYTSFLRGAKGREKYDILFIDPPYALDLTGDALRKIRDAGVCANGCTLICESNSPNIYGAHTDLADYYKILKSNRYSKTYITLLTLRERTEDSNGDA